MDEATAKTRWCPMVRVASSKDPGSAAINTPIERRKVAASSGAWCHCIGSACMMWRWRMSPHASTQQAIDADALDIEDDAGIEDMMKTAGDGYCGLAGKM